MPYFEMFTGLILVPNGQDIGYALGDYNPDGNSSQPSTYRPRNLISSKTENTTESFLPGLDDEEAPFYPRPWGLMFTIIGVVLLDFAADCCQSPARAYLLDVALPGTEI